MKSTEKCFCTKGVLLGRFPWLLFARGSRTVPETIIATSPVLVWGAELEMIFRIEGCRGSMRTKVHAWLSITVASVSGKKLI